MKNTAKLSDCRKYRYALWRTWDDSKPYVMFVGLNPSTADETTDDPTLKKCINFSKSWGYGGVCMANLFAFRATDPSNMKAAKDPIGSENNKWLKDLSKEAGLVVAAWGNHGSYLGRSKQVIELLPNMNCLKMNKSGEPAHPLYQKAKLKSVPMSHETQNINTPDSGVFITKGMKLTIPKFFLRLGVNGDVESDPVILHTGIDLSPFWLEISYVHLQQTQQANDDLIQAKEANDNDKISNALQAEFTAGMQTIMASAVAIDAFYGNIKEHIDIPKELTETWRKNGTARYKQIAEVWRRAFSISQESAQKIREILKEVTSFRDRAVHPPPNTSAPVLHPELNKVTDWRYSKFRYYNAKGIAGITLSIIAQSIQKTHKDKYKELKKYSENLLIEVGPMVARWEKKYGKLFG